MIALPGLTVTSNAAQLVVLPGDMARWTVLVVRNESAYDVALNYAGDTKTVSAWTVDYLQLNGRAAVVSVLPTLNLPNTTQPNNQVGLSLLDTSDNFSPAQYPQSLTRTVSNIQAQQIVGTFFGSIGGGGASFFSPAYTLPVGTHAVCVMPRNTFADPAGGAVIFVYDADEERIWGGQAYTYGAQPPMITVLQAESPQIRVQVTELVHAGHQNEYDVIAILSPDVVSVTGLVSVKEDGQYAGNHQMAGAATCAVAPAQLISIPASGAWRGTLILGGQPNLTAGGLAWIEYTSGGQFPAGTKILPFMYPTTWGFTPAVASGVLLTAPASGGAAVISAACVAAAAGGVLATAVGELL